MKNSRLPISLVLLTRNEERNVSEYLQRCDFAEEIVVVDDDSTDQTVAIAESMGVKRNDFFSRRVGAQTCSRLTCDTLKCRLTSTVISNVPSKRPTAITTCLSIPTS